jgi:hypothetical protein
MTHDGLHGRMVERTVESPQCFGSHRVGGDSENYCRKPLYVVLATKTGFFPFSASNDKCTMHETKKMNFAYSVVHSFESSLLACMHACMHLSSETTLASYII